MIRPTSLGRYASAQALMTEGWFRGARSAAASPAFALQHHVHALRLGLVAVLRRSEMEMGAKARSA
eukprot:10446349-Alexandrium_andersonii.AAC.1